MAILASTVCSDAGVLLQDTGATRWTSVELLEWLNEGRRAMFFIKPEVFGASGTELSHTLTSGCYQTISTTGAHKVVSVDYNVSSGKAIRLATRAQLDAYRANWRADTGSDVQNWFPDEVNPIGFWVYPAVSGASIKVHVHVVPADVASNVAALPHDAYVPALLNYVLYRAFSKEDEPGAETKAAAYFKLFTDALA